MKKITATTLRRGLAAAVALVAVGAAALIGAATVTGCGDDDCLVAGEACACQGDDCPSCCEGMTCTEGSSGYHICQ